MQRSHRLSYTRPFVRRSPDDTRNRPASFRPRPLATPRARMDGRCPTCLHSGAVPLRGGGAGGAQRGMFPTVGLLSATKVGGGKFRRRMGLGDRIQHGRTAQPRLRSDRLSGRKDHDPARPRRRQTLCAQLSRDAGRAQGPNRRMHGRRPNAASDTDRGARHHRPHGSVAAGQSRRLGRCRSPLVRSVLHRSGRGRRGRRLPRRPDGRKAAIRRSGERSAATALPYTSCTPFRAIHHLVMICLM